MTPNILTSNTSNEFRISWKDNNILLRRNDSFKVVSWLNCVLSQFNITHYAFTTGNNSTQKWDVSCPAVGVIGEKNKYLGCYQEPTLDNYPRLFNDGYNNKNRMNLEYCFHFCAALNTQYAGIGNGNGCYCSKSRPSYIYVAEESECNKNCVGDNSQKCGGFNRLSVYQLNFLGGDMVSPKRMGCYLDVDEDNTLTKIIEKYPGLLTPERCLGHCWRGGYQLAGVINGDECRCRDIVKEERKISETDCSSSCAGDSSIKCGGPSQLSVYSTGIMDDWGNNRKLGCFKDSKDRLLPTPDFKLPETNSPRRCANVCLFLGFKFSGVEYKVSCFCSNLEPASSQKVPDSDCMMQCTGDKTEECGGAWRISVSRTS